jgi:hypothetical protein
MDVPNYLLYAPRTNQQRLPIDIPNHLLYAQCHVQISQGLLIDVPDHLLYFLHVHRYERKAMDSRSTLHTTSITFSTRITAYKKHGAP